MRSWSSQPSLARSKTAGLDERRLELELADEAVEFEHLVLPVRPAEQRQVVDDRLGQVAELAVVADGGRTVPFAQLAAVRAEHHGVMREPRHGAAEGFEEQLLASAVGEVVVAADHVGDAHLAVVDDGCEVVAGHAVGAHDDRVAEGAGADGDGSADQVVDDDVSRGNQEAHGRRLARLKPPPHLLRRQREAAAVVARRPPRRQRLAAQLLEALLRAEAAVGEAGLEQLPGRGAMPFQALALPVGPGGPADVRALVPGEAEPAQVVHDARLERRVRARSVGVVHAQDEAAARVPGEEEVVERGARRADVQGTGRARGEADSHCGVEGYRRSSNVVVSPANRSSLSPRLGMLADAIRRTARPAPAIGGASALRPAGDAVSRRRAALPRDRLHAFPHAGSQARQGGSGRHARAHGRRRTLRRCRHGRRRGGRAGVHGPHPPRRGLRRRGLGFRARLVPRERLHQRHPRADARLVLARRHRDRAAQRAQVHARRADLLGRDAAVHGAGDRSSLGHPARRTRRRRPRRPRPGAGRAGALRHIAHLQRPRRRPAGDRQRSPTGPASPSSPTRPGALTCASAPSCLWTR